MTAAALSGRRVLVTRPAGQAEGIAGRIRRAGGEPVLFPTLEIVPVPAAARLDALIAALDAYDLAIFISSNAVNSGLALVRARRDWPVALRVAAVGPGSARALNQAGIGGVILPRAGFDSEGLLALPELQHMAGRRVVIFRGEGGREVLGDTLRARGAQLEYAECYRRARPKADAAPLVARCMRGEIDAVSVTSSEGLRNLWDMLGTQGQECLRSLPLFAPHERIAAVARGLGVRKVVVTAAGAGGLLDGLAAFFATV